MQTIEDFYKGGMILFDINLAYKYEDSLSGLVKRRLKKYFDYPGRYRLSSFMLDEYDKRKNKYKESDYWIEPGDPLIYIPECPRWLLLKSKHIHTLRLQALKQMRQMYGRKSCGAPY